MQTLNLASVDCCGQIEDEPEEDEAEEDTEAGDDETADDEDNESEEVTVMTYWQVLCLVIYVHEV